MITLKGEKKMTIQQMIPMRMNNHSKITKLKIKLRNPWTSGKNAILYSKSGIVKCQNSSLNDHFIAHHNNTIFKKI